MMANRLTVIAFPLTRERTFSGPILLRATLTYKPTRPILGYGHQDFFIRIENVLNRHYEEPAGYIQPGIGFYVREYGCQHEI